MQGLRFKRMKGMRQKQKNKGEKFTLFNNIYFNGLARY